MLNKKCVVAVLLAFVSSVCRLSSAAIIEERDSQSQQQHHDKQTTRNDRERIVPPLLPRFTPTAMPTLTPTALPTAMPSMLEQSRRNYRRGERDEVVDHKAALLLLGAGARRKKKQRDRSSGQEDEQFPLDFVDWLNPDAGLFCDDMRVTVQEREWRGAVGLTTRHDFDTKDFRMQPDDDSGRGRGRIVDFNDEQGREEDVLVVGTGGPLRLTFSPPVLLSELYVYLVDWSPNTVSFFSPRVDFGVAIASGLVDAKVENNDGSPLADYVVLGSEEDGGLSNGVLEFTGSNITITDLYVRSDRRANKEGIAQGLTFSRSISCS